jgi:hypothetical protein
MGYNRIEISPYERECMFIVIDKLTAIISHSNLSIHGSYYESQFESTIQANDLLRGIVSGIIDYEKFTAAVEC